MKSAAISDQLKTFTPQRKELPFVEREIFHWRHLISEIILAACSIVLAALTYLAKKTPYFPFDLTITRFIQQIHNPLIDSIMRTITFLGNPTVGPWLVVIAVLLLIMRKHTREAIFLIISTVGIVGVASLLKLFVARVRPDPYLIHQIGSFLQKDSFPSGHVSFYMGFFGFLLYLTAAQLPHNRYRIGGIVMFTLLLLLIGPSRIYVGAHWFSDVMGAYLLGILWLSAITAAYATCTKNK